MGGEQSTGYQGSDTYFNDSIDSFFKSVPAALSANKNLSVPDQEAAIMSDIGQRRLIFMGWLNNKLNQVTMSPDSKEAIRKNYLDQFAQYEDWSKGGFSNLQRSITTVKQLETRAQKNGWQIARVHKEAEQIYGPRVVEGVASILLATEAGTGTRDALDREALKIGEYLQHGARVAAGNAKTSQMAPEDQRGGMRAVTAAVDSTVRAINSGQTALPEQDLKTFGYSMADLIDSAAKSQNADNLRGALTWSASPAVIQALGKLKGANPEQAQEIGKGMMITNQKAIALNGQALMREVANINSTFTTLQRSDPGLRGRTPGRWELIYDAEQGAITIRSSGEALTPPGQLMNKIRDVNKALNANVLLGDEYGSDRERGVDDSALKQAYIQATGIPIEGGEAEAATSDDNGGKGKVSGYAPGMVENGNLDAIGRKPLDNEDGSISTALTFSRRDEDGLEVIVPQVIDGVKFSEDAAWRHYKMTGEHFGKFDTPGHADEFAKDLHMLMEEDAVAKRKAKDDRIELEVE